jgi:hypothetical protein
MGVYVYICYVSYVCVHQLLGGVGMGEVGLVSLRTHKSLNHKIGDILSSYSPISFFVNIFPRGERNRRKRGRKHMAVQKPEMGANSLFRYRK